MRLIGKVEEMKLDMVLNIRLDMKYLLVVLHVVCRQGECILSLSYT